MLKKYAEKLKNQNELYLRIKASPRSSKTLIKTIMDDDTIKIDIAAPPVKGKANQELVKFLAKEFAVSKNNVNPLLNFIKAVAASSTSL